jgi:hypothetical protein
MDIQGVIVLLLIWACLFDLYISVQIGRVQADVKQIIRERASVAIQKHIHDMPTVELHEDEK